MTYINCRIRRKNIKVQIQSLQQSSKNSQTIQLHFNDTPCED